MPCAIVGPAGGLVGPGPCILAEVQGCVNIADLAPAVVAILDAAAALLEMSDDEPGELVIGDMVPAVVAILDRPVAIVEIGDEPCA